MTKIVVIIGFLVAFAAGVMVGSLDARKSGDGNTTAATTGPTTHHNHRGGSWITSELGLNADQQKAMEQIWSETAGKGRRELDERRRAIRKERDDALTALVRPEDKPKYDQIFQDYQDKQQVIEAEMRANFANAVKQTNELLTPEQRTKYEELLKRHQWDRGPGPRGGPGRRGDDRPATRPTTQPSR